MTEEPFYKCNDINMYVEKLTQHRYLTSKWFKQPLSHGSNVMNK